MLENTDGGQHFAKERVRVDFVWERVTDNSPVDTQCVWLTHDLAHAVNRTDRGFLRVACVSHTVDFDFGGATLPWKVAEQDLRCSGNLMKMRRELNEGVART